MTPQSAKAKGRRLQQEVADNLVAACGGVLELDDIRSTSMGAGGEDILLSPLARKIYPFNIECKNVEKINIWAAIKQAEEHGKYNPLVCFKRNGEEIYVTLKLQDLLDLYNYNWNPNLGIDVLSKRAKSGI
jgi:hypothetical protein